MDLDRLDLRRIDTNLVRVSERRLDLSRSRLDQATKHQQQAGAGNPSGHITENKAETVVEFHFYLPRQETIGNSANSLLGIDLITECHCYQVATNHAYNNERRRRADLASLPVADFVDSLE